MPFGAATLSAICPCPRELSRPDTPTATDTVRRNILTCANMQERLHYDKYSAGSSKRALPCRGRSESTVASLQAPQHAGPYDLPGPSQNAWPNSFQTSYGNPVSSPVIVRLLAPHATLTGQTGAVLAIFAVAALQAHVLAATIERIARKLLQAGGFVAMAAAFACLWLVPGRPPRCCRSCCCSCVEISALWSPRPPEPRIITAGVSRTGSVPRLTPPLRGQPFQAGCGVFACLGLAPEQLIGLGQHQRVRAAELPDLVLDWQLGGADLSLTCLRRVSASGHSSVRSLRPARNPPSVPHSSQPQPPDQGTDQSSSARAGRSVIAVSRRSHSRASSSRGALGPGPAARSIGSRQASTSSPCSRRAVTISPASAVPSAAASSPASGLPSSASCLRRVAGDGYLSQSRISSSSQPHDAASSQPAVAAAPASRSAAVSPGSAPAQPLRSTSPVYCHVFRDPNRSEEPTSELQSPMYLVC